MEGCIERCFNRGYLSSNAGEDKALGLVHHLFSRGHVGKVECVSASIDGQYVVTGGVDYTTRVWKFDLPKEEIKKRKEAENNKNKEKEMEERERNGKKQGESKQNDKDEERGNIGEDLDGVREEVREVLLAGREQTKSADNSIPTESFDLHAVLYHEHKGPDDNRNVERIGVTASAFVGETGPVISGLSEGMMTVFYVEGNDCKVQCVDAHHDKCINELCVGKLETGTWVATACQDTTAQVFSLTMEEGLVVKGVLKHEDPVLFVRFLRSKGSKPMFVTCTEKTIQIWDEAGNRKETLKMEIPGQDPPRLKAVTATCQEEVALIFASDGENISTWAIEDGKVLEHQRETKKPDRSLATYKHKNQGIDCDQDNQHTDYVVHQADDYTIHVWNLLAVKPHRLAMAPKPKESYKLLVTENSHDIELQLVHKSKVLDFRVVEDEFEGPVLISAAGDTGMIWDIEGEDKGEVTAQLRSMRLREVVLPPTLLIITFVQVSSFAFGPANWNGKVKDGAQGIQKFALFDIEILSISIDKNLFFWACAVSAIAAMIGFLLAELIGLYAWFDRVENQLQSGDSYRDEVKGQRSFGPCHLFKSFLNACQTCWGLMIYAASTFLIAPIAKECATMFDCTENGVLLANPSMHCWSSSHKQMAVLTGVVFPLFLLGLAPYVVVIGDPSYVQQDELLNPKQWVENWSASACRKATVLNQGPWHPNPRFIFRNTIVEFLSKASIPFASVLLKNRPRLQMGVMSAIGFIMLITTVLYPSRTEVACGALVFGLRLFTFLMMLIGLLVAILDDPESPWPLWSLICVSVLVPAWTIWRIIINFKTTKKDVIWKSTAVTDLEKSPLLQTP